MTKVKIIQNTEDYSKGEVTRLTDEKAKKLCQQGFAKKIFKTFKTTFGKTKGIKEINN